MILQCCYTNTGRLSGDFAGTWKPGGSVQHEAENLCLAVSRSVQDRIRGAGNRLEPFYDLRCKGGFLCLTRTLPVGTEQGVAFSHSILFPVRNLNGNPEENVLHDPSRFLTLSEKNFLSAPAEAAAWSTDAVPLARDAPLNLSDAVAQAGIPNREAFATLLRSVYALKIRKRNSVVIGPLYVVCDGTVRKMRALLFCIWSGLPWFMRQSLRVVSEPCSRDGEYDIVFTSRPPTGNKLSVDPAKGVTTGKIVSLETRKRMQRYRCLEIAASELSYEEIPSFYLDMARNSENSSDEGILMVYGLKYFKHLRHPSGSVVERYDERELLDWVTDALKMRDRSGEIERYLADMVSELEKRHLTERLQNEARENLRTWKEAERRERESPPDKIYNIDHADGRITLIHSAVPSDNALRYHFWRPDGTMIDEEAVKLDIADLTPAQRETSKSVEEAIQKALKNKKLRYEALENVWLGIKDQTLWGYRSFKRVFMSAAWKVYTRSIRERTSEKDAENFESFKEMAKLIWVEPDNAISDAKLAYWDLDGLPVSENEDVDPLVQVPVLSSKAARLNFSQFSFDKLAFYNEIEVDHPNCRLFLDFLQVAAQCVSEQNSGEWLSMSAQFFVDHPVISKDSRNTALKLLAQHMADNSSNDLSDLWYEQWIFFAADESFPYPERDAMFWQSICAMYRAALKRDGSELYDSYSRFTKNTEGLRDKENIRKQLAALLQTICNEYERGDGYAPLDFWLVLGLAMKLTPGCFNVFDPKDTVFPERPGYDARLFQMRPGEVIADSKLIFDKTFQSFAEDYVSRMSSKKRKRYVAAWLNAARKGQR